MGVQLDLTGRTALVTGSTRASARPSPPGWRRSGARVAVNGRSRRRVGGRRRPMLAAETGGAFVAAPGERHARMTARPPCWRRPGALDVLVNNLGVFECRSGPRDHRRRVAAVLRGERALRGAVDPDVPARDVGAGWGRVVYIASDSAIVTPVEMIHYGITMTALLAVTRGFAKAGGRHAVSP